MLYMTTDEALTALVSMANKMTPAEQRLFVEIMKNAPLLGDNNIDPAILRFSMALKEKTEVKR